MLSDLYILTEIFSGPIIPQRRTICGVSLQTRQSPLDCWTTAEVSRRSWTRGHCKRAIRSLRYRGIPTPMWSACLPVQNFPPLMIANLWWSLAYLLSKFVEIIWYWPKIQLELPCKLAGGPEICFFYTPTPYPQKEYTPTLTYTRVGHHSTVNKLPLSCFFCFFFDGRAKSRAI